MARTIAPKAKRPARKPGRPTKLTPELQRRVCTLLRLGMPRERAARLAGISASTFHNWMAEGAAAEGGPYLEFFEAVQRAEDSLVKRALSTVVDLMAPKYEPSTRLKAATTVLRTRFSGDFSTRQEVTGKGGEPVKVEAAVTVQPIVSNEALRDAAPGQVHEIILALVERPARSG
jgi:hypothetical protein